MLRYIRGNSLRTALRRGPWSLPRTTHLLEQLATALAYTHRQGIAHRNLKPANVLLDAEGNAGYGLSLIQGADQLSGETPVSPGAIAATASALPNGFPRGCTRRFSNLPVPLTALLGREQELAAPTALLRDLVVRLVTLSGPGGIGKTRLGLQVATTLADEFPDGVYFVDLAPIREPPLVLSAIAQTLGVRESGGQPLVRQLQQVWTALPR